MIGRNVGKQNEKIETKDQKQQPQPPDPMNRKINKYGYNVNKQLSRRKLES